MIFFQITWKFDILPDQVDKIILVGFLFSISIIILLWIDKGNRGRRRRRRKQKPTIAKIFQAQFSVLSLSFLLYKISETRTHTMRFSFACCHRFFFIILKSSMFENRHVSLLFLFFSFWFEKRNIELIIFLIFYSLHQTGYRRHLNRHLFSTSSSSSTCFLRFVLSFLVANSFWH